jgi:hypothetical protein
MIHPAIRLQLQVYSIQYQEMTLDLADKASWILLRMPKIQNIGNSKSRPSKVFWGREVRKVSMKKNPVYLKKKIE